MEEITLSTYSVAYRNITADIWPRIFQTLRDHTNSNLVLHSHSWLMLHWLEDVYQYSRVQPTQNQRLCELHWISWAAENSEKPRHVEQNAVCRGGTILFFFKYTVLLEVYYIHFLNILHMYKSIINVYSDSQTTRKTKKEKKEKNKTKKRIN